MKKIIFAALFASSIMSAQDMDIVKGDFGFLKDQKEINVEFDYSKMTLLNDKVSEEQYVANRSKELNEKTKSLGDTWAKKWGSSKELIWNPKFLELLNLVLVKEKKEVVYQEASAAAKYTLIIETVWVYPGFDIGIMKQPAKVTTQLKFVETSNKSNVLLEISSENAPGDQWGNNYSNESRIGESFAKTAKSLAKMLLKKAYK